MKLTYQKVFGAIGGVSSLILTVFLVFHLGTPGHPMGLGLSILVIVVTYICYAVGSAIGGAIDDKRSERVPPGEPK